MLLVLFILLAAPFADAQQIEIGVIDYYGLGALDKTRVEKALGLSAGDRLPPSKGDVEVRLEQVQGVVRANVEVYCCEAGKPILYVGLEAKGAPHFDYRPPPEGAERLPDYVLEDYRAYIEALARATLEDTRQDLSSGQPLMAGVTLRPLQHKFVIHAELHGERARQVLRNSADPQHRAAAALILGFAKRKAQVVDDLLYALQDEEDNVRVNALRALSAIGVLAQKKPDLEIRIPPTWLVEMLHSIFWRDRYHAAQTLASITETLDKATLDLIRERALVSILEMARWKHLPHALPAFLLAGRLAGMPEDAILDAWSRGDRQKVIEAASSQKL